MVYKNCFPQSANCKYNYFLIGVKEILQKINPLKQIAMAAGINKHHD